MKTSRLLPGLVASLVMLAVLALAPPVAADSPTSSGSVSGAASVSASIDEVAASTGGIAGDVVGVSGGVTVEPSGFPATRLATNQTVRIGWDLATDAYQIGVPGVDNGMVYALATSSDGTVYVGGSFTSAGGNTSNQYVAKWRRGTGWQALGSFSAGTVYALAIGSDGSVYAGGNFADVKKWNGSSWSTVGSAVFSGGSVRALAISSGGVLYAGGDFTSPVAGLAKYSGGSWSAVGGGIYNNNADVYALLSVGSDLYVGGSFLNVGAADGLPAANLARWDGGNWYTVGSTPPLSAQQYVDALATSEGNLYVANRDVAAGGFHFYQVADPAGSATAWTQLASSTNCADIANDCDRVYAVAASQNNVFIAGTFTNSNATFVPALSATTSSMAWWNRKANTWSAVDGGVSAPANGVIPGWMQGVRAVTINDSSVFAGGEFVTVKGSSVNAARIARWNQTISDLALFGSVSPVGQVYVGDKITYNLNVENLGYAQATGTSVYATLPAGVTYVPYSSSNPGGTSSSSCSNASGLVTCSPGNINWGSTAAFKIVVQVPSSALGGTVYNFTANVKANQYDPTLVSSYIGSAQATFSNTAQEKAVLTLAMTGPASAAGNEVLAYSMTVVNTGPSTAHGATLVDTLPTGALYAEGSSGCTYNVTTNKVTCALGDLLLNDSKTVTVSYMTGTCTTGALVNNASATSPQTVSPAVASVSTNINPFTGLALNKSDGRTLVGLNENLTYKIKVWACGLDVPNVVITDPLPSSLTWISTSPSVGVTCTQTGGTVTCNAGTLPSGTSVDVSITAKTTVETLLENTATANGDGVSSATGTDDDTQVGDFADLTVVLSTASEDVTAGVAYNYTVAVTNNGPSSVTDAAVNVNLPDGVYYNSTAGATCALDTGSLNISANLTCTLGAMAVDEDKSFTVSATAVQPVQGPDVDYTATATVTSAKDHDSTAENTDDADTTATAGTQTTQTINGLDVEAYVFETAGTDKHAYGVGLDSHFYLAGLNDSVTYAASGATSLSGGGKLNYKKGSVPVYDGDFTSTQGANWKLTLDSDGKAKVPDVAGFKIKVPENSTLSEVDLPNGKVKGTTAELQLDPPNTVKEVDASFELDSSTTKPDKPSYGGKVTEGFLLDAGIFKLDIPINAPISDTGINSTSNVDLVMPAYFGSGEVNGSSAGLRHWPGLQDASMTVGGAPGAGFNVPDLKFDTADNFKVKQGVGQLVSAGGKYEAVITSSKLEIDLPANDNKEIKKGSEQGGTLDTVYLSPKEDENGNPVLLPDNSIDSDISTSALPEFHLDVAKGDLKVVSAMLKKDGIQVSLADYKMPAELGERNKVTPDVKVKPKKDVTQAEMKLKSDESFDVADMNVKDGDKLKVKQAKAKVVQQSDGFKLDVVSAKLQVTILEQNDKLTDVASATVDKDGKFDGKLANDELTIKVASADLTMKGLSKDHALTSGKGLESDAGKWKLPTELGGQEKDFTPTDKIKIDNRGLKINEDKEVDFPAGNLDNAGHPFESGKVVVKEAEDRTYKAEIKGKIQIDIPGSQGKKPGTEEKPDAELTLDSQKKIKGKVNDMELNVSGLTLKDKDWKVEKGQVFSDKATMKQISDFGGKESGLGQLAVLDKNSGLVLGAEAGAAAAAGMSPDKVAEVADIDVTLPSLEYLGFSMFDVNGSIHATDRYAADGTYCIGTDGEPTDTCDGVKDSYAIEANASLGLEDIFGGGGSDDGGGAGAGSGGSGGSGGEGGGGEGSSLPCSSISVAINLVLGEKHSTVVTIKPTQGRIVANTLVHSTSKATPSGIDDLELKAIAAQLTLSCSVPLGESGLELSEFTGGFKMDKDEDLMEANVGVTIDTVMKVPPPIDAPVASGEVAATIRIKPNHFFRVEGEVTVIGFIKMAEGYAQVDFTDYGMPNGVEAEVTIRYPVWMEGYVGFHVWTDWDPVNGPVKPELDDFHFTGWAGVRVGISKGLIWEGCALGICISIPPWDLWLAEVRAEVGEFCKEGGGSVWGFKCEVSILNGLWSGGMYVDADGNVDFGDVDEYVLYDNDAVTQAFLAWRDVRSGKLTAEQAMAASQQYKGFTFGPDADVSYTYNVAKPADLLFMLSRTGAAPTMTLTDPDGDEINSLSDYRVGVTGLDYVAYDEATTTTQDEDGNNVDTTQVTYAIHNAKAGQWIVHLTGVDPSLTQANYVFTLIGAGLAPSLGNFAVAQTGTSAAVSWTLTADAAPVVSIYATKGPTEQEVTDPSDKTKTMTLPVFGGERLLQVTNSKIDGTVNTATVDLSGLENGDYYIHIDADDAKDPPQHLYWTDGQGKPTTLTVNQPLPTTWAPEITVTPAYMGLHVAFTPLDNPNVDKFVVRFSDKPFDESPTYVREVWTVATSANSEDWLTPGQPYYISVGAVDGDTGHLECVNAGCDLTNPMTPTNFVGATIVWSEEVSGTPYGASYELVATEPAATLVGGGDSATVHFKVVNTGDAAPNVGLYVEDAPAGIDVVLTDRFVMSTDVGAQTSLLVSANDTVRGGVYPVKIGATGGGTLRILDLLVTVQEPHFELSAVPASVQMQTGDTASVQVDVTRLFGELDPVNLEIVAPRGLDWSLDSDRLDGTTSGILTLTDTFMVPGGNYTVHVVGRDGENEYDLAIPLVLSKPKFTLAAKPLNWRAAPDSDVSIPLAVGAEYGWDTPVTLSINTTYLPYGISGGLSATSSGTPEASLTVTPPTTVYLKMHAAADAAEDLYVLHVDAEGGEQAAVVEPRLWVRSTCDVADVSITVTDAPDPVLTDGLLTYTLHLANDGPCTSTVRTLTVGLPAGVAYQSASDLTCSVSGSTVTCQVPPFAPTATPSTSITVKAPSGGTGPLNTTFSLNAVTADWESGNNSATAETTLKNAPVVGTIALAPAAVEGQTLYAVASFTDADGDAPFNCTVNYGSGAETGMIVGSECHGAPHIFADNGTFPVTVSVTDASGASGAQTQSVAVTNAAPLVGPIDISLKPSTENESVAISATFADAGTGDGPWSCRVDYGDGSIGDGVVTNDICLGPAHVYTDNGGFQVKVSVMDKDSGVGIRTTTMVVKNVAPELTVSNSGPVTEGAEVTITATATDVAGAADPLVYAFDCKNDGSWDTGLQSGTTAKCVFEDNGTYDVQVQVGDGDGGWTFGSTQVVVNNAAPVVNPVQTSPVSPLTNRGKVTASATFSDVGALDFVKTSTLDWDTSDQDPAATTSTCTVDYGDGTVQTRPIVGGNTCYGLPHRYHASGTYDITITVADKDGGVGTSTTAYEVQNVAPQIETPTVSPSPAKEGELVTASALFSDGDLADGEVATGYACTVDYGDGSGTLTGTIDGRTCTGPQHKYADNGEYTVTATVADDFGVADSKSTTVSVTNVAPTVQKPTFSQEPSDEGTQVNIAASFTDPGTADTFTCKVTFGDVANETPVDGVISGNATDGYTCSATHTYADNSTPPETGYVVTVTVTDDDHDAGSSTATHKVSNVNPTVTGVTFAPEPSNEGSQVIVTATFTDPAQANDAPFGCALDYGDGQTGTGSVSGFTCTATHTYADNSTPPEAGYKVKATITDNDGGSGWLDVTHAVTNVTPQVDAGPDATINEGGTFTGSGSFTDPGADTWTATVDYGDGAGATGLTLNSIAKTFQLSHTYADNGIDTVSVCVIDDEGAKRCDEVKVTVKNVAPTVAVPSVTPEPSDEGQAVTASATFSDPGILDAPFVCKIDFGDGTTVVDGTVTRTDATHYTCATAAAHGYADNTTPEATGWTVKFTVTDKDADPGSNKVQHIVHNVAPAVTVDVTTQTAQYSDHIADVTITAKDMKADPLSLTTQWKLGSNPYAAGLPGDLTASSAPTCVDVLPYSQTCTWKLTGVLNVAAGTYTIEATVDDGDGAKVPVTTVVTVTAEQVHFTFPDTNPTLVKVATPGGVSGAFTLAVTVAEKQPDTGTGPMPGDISRATVSMQLLAVGPGSAPTGTCSKTTTPGTGYSGYVTYTCNFTAAAVNTYVVAVTVNGGYYAGYMEDGVTVYDPSLGFTSGGGWFYWPNTANPATGYLGDKTNFGFTMKYKKGGANVSGNLLVIRHVPGDQIYRVKSNALTGLALSPTNNAYGWANFTGKSTYQEPGWPDAVGNYTFTVYVEDRNEPGTGVDRFWIQVKDKDGNVVVAMSMPMTGAQNAVNIGSGNIQVPHGTSGKTAALSSFSATASSDGVQVRWQTLSEPDLAGFNLYRSSLQNGEWVRCNGEVIQASGDDQVEGALYSWADVASDGGEGEWYRLEAVSSDGTTEVLAEIPVLTHPVYLPIIVQ